MSANIEAVLRKLAEMEFGNKPLTATDQLLQKLNELLSGKQVPVVIFQCIDFNWTAAQNGQYLQALARADFSSPICQFYERNIIDIIQQLSCIGKPQLSIIIPDSELFDDRPFSFTQSLKERQELAISFSTELPKLIPKICDEGGTVMLWSDYCKNSDLLSPTEYTTKNFGKINQEQKLIKKVRDQVKDSRRFFARNGLDTVYLNSIPNEEMEKRVGWYCAMYMGEGQALNESKAICLNLEDGRVPAWFQRGANGNLPILTPVDPNDFYQRRKQLCL